MFKLKNLIMFTIFIPFLLILTGIILPYLISTNILPIYLIIFLCFFIIVFFICSIVYIFDISLINMRDRYKEEEWP